MAVDLDEQKLPASRYAPAKPTPDKIGSVMLKSVAKMADVSAAELEQTATDLERGAAEIAAKLRELASAMKDHAEVASEHVTAFCERASTVFQGALELQARLRGEAPAADPKEKVDEAAAALADKPPDFLINGQQR